MPQHINLVTHGNGCGSTRADFSCAGNEALVPFIDQQFSDLFGDSARASGVNGCIYLKNFQTTSYKSNNFVSSSRFSCGVYADSSTRYLLFINTIFARAVFITTLAGFP